MLAPQAIRPWIGRQRQAPLGAAVRVVVRLLTTLIAISIVIFGLTALAGNPAHDILGQNATSSQIAAFTVKHGLDEPLPLRYLTWVGGLLHGDLGTSFESNGPVAALLAPRIVPTLLLVLVSWVLVVIIAVPVGLLAGVRLRGRQDLTLTLFTLCLAALPEFVFGLILAIVFAVLLGWLPVSSTALSLGGPFSSPAAYVLPAITVASGSIPYIVRLMRANAREISGETYVAAAVLRGITEPAISLRHVLPNAAPPVVTALGLQLAGMIGGVIVAETLFGFPGLGQLIVSAAAARDTPVVEALAMITGTAFVLVNLGADVVVRWMTPRLRDRVR